MVMKRMGLGEYPVAASSAAMFLQDLIVQVTATGFVTVGVAGTENNLGSLNGVFYTDANYKQTNICKHFTSSNTATDIVALVNDSPLQQYEVRSNNCRCFSSN